MSNSNNEANEIQSEYTNGEPVDQPEVEQQQFLRTLPRKLKSLVGTSIKIESEKPKDLIELMGNVLEVNDYETNLATYWFLDTIALHVLRHRKDLDERHLGILISWLAGEMTLIRDRRYLREQFFEEMEKIFNMTANKTSEENRLPYWDEILRDIDSETSEGEEFSGEEESERQEFGKVNEDGLSKAAENEPSVASKENVELSGDTDAFIALHAVIESTYNMYANEFRYHLVYAVFAEPIEIKTHNIQFTIRTPRPVKLVESKTVPFILGLRSLLESKFTKRGKKGKKRIILGPSGVPATPPPSLMFEEILISKRQLILPLIEANEASETLTERKEEIEE